MSIAQSLIEILQEEMARHEATYLRSVRLAVGKLSAVVPEALRFCFGVMTQGTPMEGAQLVIETIPLQALCRGCRETFEVEEYTFVCPRCGGKDLALQGGQELSVVEMEVD